MGVTRPQWVNPRRFLRQFVWRFRKYISDIFIEDHQPITKSPQWQKGIGLHPLLYMSFKCGFMLTWFMSLHCYDVIIGTIASKNTSLTIVYSAVYSGANQRKYQRSASLAFVWGIHRWPVNSPHKWPVTRKLFPLIMNKDRFVSTNFYLYLCDISTPYN